MWGTDLERQLRRLWHPHKFDLLHGLTFPSYGMVKLLSALTSLLHCGWNHAPNHGHHGVVTPQEEESNRPAETQCNYLDLAIPPFLKVWATLYSVVILRMDFLKHVPPFVPEHEHFGLSKTKATALVRLGHWSLGNERCSLIQGEVLFTCCLC